MRDAAAYEAGKKAMWDEINLWLDGVSDRYEQALNAHLDKLDGPVKGQKDEPGQQPNREAGSK